jgi:hypothetical protein
MRITKKDLDSKVELLNNMTGNPIKAYEQEKGKWPAPPPVSHEKHLVKRTT